MASPRPYLCAHSVEAVVKKNANAMTYLFTDVLQIAFLKGHIPSSSGLFESDECMGMFDESLRVRQINIGGGSFRIDYFE